jgi:protein-L-isoaspartate(D-aspartate) O-methyltransferase
MILDPFNPQLASSKPSATSHAPKQTLNLASLGIKPVDWKPIYPNAAFEQYQGVGMTSQRTRNRLVERLLEKGLTHPVLLEVLRCVPRHLFLDEALASRAYEDTALPIGFGQTISQPWVVAKMTQWLLNGPLNDPVAGQSHQAWSGFERVLEIGTGSGYQTAILSLLSKEVYSVERIQTLSNKAQAVLSKLELNNVMFDVSDGHWGWPQHAPFDAIISAASPETLPEALIEQLKVGGRLIIPIGQKQQKLFGYEKTLNGVTEHCLAEVLFVPMKTGVEI